MGQEPPVDGPPMVEPPVDGKPAVASLSPTTGPVDSEVTITGDSCLAGEKPGALNFGFTRKVDGTVFNLSPLDGYVANPDGTWSFSTTVPPELRDADGALQPLEPGPGYEFHAVCIFDEQPDLWVWYPPMPFEVTGPRTFHPPSPGTPSAPGNPQSPSNPATSSTPSPATPIEDPPPFTG